MSSGVPQGSILGPLAEMAVTTASMTSIPKPFTEGNNNYFRYMTLVVLPMVGKIRPKLKKLSTLLEGEALAVWLELS